jgi:hypothetical protein
MLPPPALRQTLAIKMALLADRKNPAEAGLRFHRGGLSLATTASPPMQIARQHSAKKPRRQKKKPAREAG